MPAGSPVLGGRDHPSKNSKQASKSGVLECLPKFGNAHFLEERSEYHSRFLLRLGHFMYAKSGTLKHRWRLYKVR